MKLDMPIFKRFAPSMMRAIIISAVALAFAALIAFFGIWPKRVAIRAAGEELHTLNVRLSQMRGDIDHSEAQNKATSKAIEKRDAFVALGVLEPLLGSMAMRGKMLLDPIAQQAGFRIDSVRELPPILLQLPKPSPEQLYCRQFIEFTGQGSYTQITAFVAQVEAANPLATLSGFLVLGQPQTPETHKAVVTFEWPAKGEKAKPTATAKK